MCIRDSNCGVRYASCNQQDKCNRSHKKDVRRQAVRVVGVVLHSTHAPEPHASSRSWQYATSVPGIVYEAHRRYAIARRGAPYHARRRIAERSPVLGNRTSPFATLLARYRLSARTLSLPCSQSQTQSSHTSGFNAESSNVSQISAISRQKRANFSSWNPTTLTLQATLQRCTP
eukprot:1624515-Rhodomonas_salina.4